MGLSFKNHCQQQNNRRVKANIIKSIFNRKGGIGKFTADGCIIPNEKLTELKIQAEDIVLSYFRNNDEWCLLTERFIYFNNFKVPSSVKLSLKDICHVKPLSISQIGTIKPPQINCLFITSKDNTEYSIYLEEGNPLYGFLQVIDHISKQNDCISK